MLESLCDQTILLVGLCVDASQCLSLKEKVMRESAKQIKWNVV